MPLFEKEEFVGDSFMSIMGDKKSAHRNSWGCLPMKNLCGRSRGISYTELSSVDSASLVSCSVGASNTIPNLSDMDKVPMDFTSRGRIINDPAEARLALSEENIHAKIAFRHPESEGRLLGANIYMVEPWFHYGLSREDAENMLKKHGFKEGTFLIRTSKRIGGFVLCLAHGSLVYHYPIFCCIDQNRPNEQHYFTLDHGRTRFKDLFQLVDFYQMNSAGVLPCKLGNYVTRPLQVPARREKNDSTSSTPPKSIELRCF